MATSEPGDFGTGLQSVNARTFTPLEAGLINHKHRNQSIHNEPASDATGSDDRAKSSFGQGRQLSAYMIVMNVRENADLHQEKKPL